MGLNISPGQQGVPGPLEKSYFDFVVAERPIYIPGSGPPLAPITIMPPDDKKGIIVDEVKLGDARDSWRYIVTYVNEPALRLSVKPERVLDYVSQRTYEKYMANKDKMTNLSAKEFRSLQRKQEKPKGSRAGPGKQGRKRKHIAVEEGEAKSALSTASVGFPRSPVVPQPSSARRRKFEVAEEPTFISPHSQHSRKLSFGSPSKQRGLAELVPSESEEELNDTATEAALQRQLLDEDGFDNTLATEDTLEPNLDENMRRRRNPLLMPLSSPSTSPERTEARVEVFIKPNKSRFSEVSRGQTRNSLASTSNGNGTRPRQSNRQTPVQPREDSVASISSREAAMVYENLEWQKLKSKKGSISEKHSRFFDGSHNAATAKTTPKSKKSAAPPTNNGRPSVGPSAIEEVEEAIPEGDEEEDDDEYEVEDVLGEEYRDDIDGRTLYYLIKWVGDWDNTWEPAVNVGSDVVAEYKKKKRRLERLMRASSERSMSHDSARKGSHTTNGKGKAKSSTQATPYESEEESLFVPLPKRSRESSGGISNGKGRGKGKEIATPLQLKRGEVIDDTSDSNYGG